jgi:hypothetical protein
VTRLGSLIIISILFTSVCYAIPGAIPAGHSTTVGVVCIAPGGGSSCPVSPPLINATSGTQVRVAVVVSGSAGLQGFDIILLADSSILKPANISLTGTVVIGSIGVLAECLGTVKVKGSACNPLDTSDTLELALNNLGQGNSIAPTTGLLFTAIYNVTSSAANIPIGFQTGCSGTSVSDVCVTIANGTPTPNLETVQTGKFASAPYFDLQAYNITSSVSVAKLSLLPPSTSTSLGLNVTSVNNFDGTVDLAAGVSPSTPDITVSVSPAIVAVNTTDPSSPGFENIIVTVSAAASAHEGNYNLTFTGTSGTLPHNTLVVLLHIIGPDFSISASPTSLQFNVTTTASSVISFVGVDNFVGLVNLTVTPSPPGIVCSLTSYQINMTTVTSGSTTLNLNSTIGGFYDVNVTGVAAVKGEVISHSVIVSVTVADFSITAAAMTMNIGTVASESLYFGSDFSIESTVTLGSPLVSQTTSGGTIAPSHGISATVSPTVVSINGAGPDLAKANCTVSAYQAGNYTVTIVATSGRAIHAAAFAVQVHGVDFTLNPSTAVQTVTVGGTATFNVTLAQQLGFNGTISLTAQILNTTDLAPPLTASLNVASVTLSSTSPNATALVTISSSPGAPTAIYTVVLTAFTAQITHTATVKVVVTTTVSPHDLVVYSVTTTQTSASVGSSLSITIVVKNLGTVPENSTIIALAGNLAVANQNFTNLLPGHNITVTLIWHTSGFDPGAYSIGGQVLGVSGETSPQNNILRSSESVTLTTSTSILQSSYLELGLIIALIVLIAVIALLVLQARRKIQRP